MIDNEEERGEIREKGRMKEGVEGREERVGKNKAERKKESKGGKRGLERIKQREGKSERVESRGSKNRRTAISIRVK